MRVAILGCGYVGLALGGRLLDAGHEVVGIRRSESGLAAIEEAGMQAVRADVTDADALERVPDVDALVYAVSAGGRGVAAARESYVAGLRTAIDAFGGREESPERLVYTSSTGVFGDHSGDLVDEETPLRPATERQRILVEAERLARERAGRYGMDASVVRLAGLYGPGRYRLERYLDGPVAEGWVNLIHREDAAGILQMIVEREGRGEGEGYGGGEGYEEGEARPDLLVAVDDEPAWKPDLADWLAEQCGVPALPKQAGESESRSGQQAGSSRRARSRKRCSNRLVRSLGYEYRYPNYREGYRDAIREYLRDV